MRTGLIAVGVILLVIGILFYMVPIQEFTADANTTAVTVPEGWAYAFAAIGGVLFIFGLIAPGATKTVKGPRGPRGRTRYYRRAPRRYKRATLPRGTSVTTTTRIKR